MKTILDVLNLARSYTTSRTVLTAAELGGCYE